MPFPAIIEALNECREVIESARAEGIDFHVARQKIDAAFAEMGSPDGQALQALINERARQNQQWGGPSHDDTHQAEDWITYIQQQIEKFTDGPPLFPNGIEGDDPEAEWAFDNERLIKIGALAVAALASRARIKLASDLAKAQSAAAATSGREGVANLR